MIEIKRYTVSIMNTNCYLIMDTDSRIGAIVDPGKPSKDLDLDIKACKQIKYILLTHGHFDHIGGAVYYREITKAPIVIGKNEAEFTKDPKLNMSLRFKRSRIDNFETDILVNDGDSLEFSDKEIKVISTPGHTKGSVSYILDNLIFTGDTLFNNDIGRCDLPTGNEEQIMLSIKKILEIGGEYVVYPGHGEFTTIQNEQKNFKYV